MPHQSWKFNCWVNTSFTSEWQSSHNNSGLLQGIVPMKSPQKMGNKTFFFSKMLWQFCQQQNFFTGRAWCFRADSRFAPSQCETLLQSNTVSYWLGANLESAPCLYAYRPHGSRRLSTQSTGMADASGNNPVQTCRAHSGYGLNQWEKMLLSNVVSQWLSRYP